MREFVLKILKYSILAMLLISVVSFASLYFLRKSEFYKPSYLVNHFKEKTNFDYIILGSSRGLTTVNTTQIDSKLDSKGVNLSIDDTSLSTHSLMLEHFFNNGFKTRKVVLTLDPASFEKEDIKLSDNDYRFLPFVFNDLVHNYYFKNEKGAFKKLTYSRYFPFLGVSFYNAEIFFPSLLSIFKPKKHNRFDHNGNYQYPLKKLKSNIKLTSYEIEVSNPFLLDLKNICNSYNAELILYIAPIYNTQYVINNKVDLKIINHANLIHSPSYFYDIMHVNQNGRKIATDALVGFIK